MADDTTPAGQPGTDPAAGTQPHSETPAKTPGPVPYDRFAEVNQKYKDAQAALDKIEQERKQHELDLAKRRGDFDALEKAWQDEKAQLTASLRATQEEFGIARALSAQQLAVSSALIRAHATETGVDLGADGGIDAAVASFLQAYPQFTAATQARESSTPGSGPPSRESGPDVDGKHLAARVVESFFVSPFAPRNPMLNKG